MIKDGVTQYIIVEIPDLCGGGGGGGEFAVKNNFAVYGIHNELGGINFQSSGGENWIPNQFSGGMPISIPENFDGKYVTGKVILRLYTNWSGGFNPNDYVESIFHISNIYDNKLILPNFSGGHGTSIQGSAWHWPGTSGQFVQVWMQAAPSGNTIDFTNPSTIQFTIFGNMGFTALGWELRIEYLETVPVI